MTILTAVTDIIAHKPPPDFDCHHLTLCVCVSSLSDNRSFRRTILHGMMGDQGISSGVIPHGLGESICDISLVWCGVIRVHFEVVEPDLVLTSTDPFPVTAPSPQQRGARPEGGQNISSM